MADKGKQPAACPSATPVLDISLTNLRYIDIPPDCEAPDLSYNSGHPTRRRRRVREGAAKAWVRHYAWKRIRA